MNCKSPVGCVVKDDWENLSGTADFNRGIRPITHLCHPVKTHQLPEKFLSYKINLSVGVLLFFKVGQSAEHGLRSQKVN